MALSKAEEDYLKALFHLNVESDQKESRSSLLAEYLDVSQASVNSMLKKLKKKELVAFERYGKVKLTASGEQAAVQLTRKHRLWETFLYQHMNFSWDEVHEVAEQLEHIRSKKLITELDKFLGLPKYDPHGAIIPSAEGHYELLPKITLSSLKAGDICRIVSVKDSSVAFLQYVSKIGLALSSQIIVVEIQEFDQSMVINFEDNSLTVSKKFADNVFVECIPKP